MRSQDLEIYQEAVEVISQALKETTSTHEEVLEHNARAIIARLAHRNILLERYEKTEDTTKEETK